MKWYILREVPPSATGALFIFLFNFVPLALLIL